MEDNHFEIGKLTENCDSLFAVFDGHGGSAVSKFCSEHFTSVMKADESFVAGNIGEALRRTYMKLDEMLKEASNGPKKTGNHSGETLTGAHPSVAAPQVLAPPLVSTPRRSMNFALTTGCTAVVVYIDKTTVTVANTGDSRAVLCRDGMAVELTTDHKVTLRSEIDRITAAGGVILNGRVNGSLNLTRAIGDLAFKNDLSLAPEKQVITANPDITKIDLDPNTDDFIVIACDGLWEVMTSQEVIEYVSHGLHAIRGTPASPSASVTSILPSCLSDLIGRMLDIVCSDDVGKTEGLGGDNLSCIIVDLRPNKTLSNLDIVSRCDNVDPFVVQPESYKAFEFRTGSSEGADFTDGDWECRIEKLDDSNFEHSSASP